MAAYEIKLTQLNETAGTKHDYYYDHVPNKIAETMINKLNTYWDEGQLKASYYDDEESRSANEYAGKRIQLTTRNLIRYGQVVLTKEYKNPEGMNVTERYIIWDTCRMNGDTDPEVLKRSENKKKMFLLTQVNGSTVTMKQI